MFFRSLSVGFRRVDRCISVLGRCIDGVELQRLFPSVFHVVTGPCRNDHGHVVPDFFIAPSIQISPVPFSTLKNWSRSLWTSSPISSPGRTAISTSCIFFAV